MLTHPEEVEMPGLSPKHRAAEAILLVCLLLVASCATVLTASLRGGVFPVDKCAGTMHYSYPSVAGERGLAR